MISFSIVIQFILTAILTLAVLLQKSSSIGLGAYSGSNESVFGAKGPAGFLTKATFAVGVLFIINTVFLTYSFNKEKNKSVVDSVKVLTPTQNIPAK
jgi:preprotein translocase subunit SecG